MSYPERQNPFIWATDDTHNDPGKAWDAQPNKVEPSLAQKQAGWLPEDKPPAEWRNWALHVITTFLDWIAGVQVSLENWKPADFTLVSGSTWCPFNDASDIVHSPTQQWFCAIDENGYTIITEDPGITASSLGSPGLKWDEETVQPNSDADWVVVCPDVQMECTTAGTRIVVGTGINAGQVLRSVSPGAWVSTATATAASWRAVACSRAGSGVVWAVGGTAAQIDTSPDGTTWTARTSGMTGSITNLEHNRETGSDARFVALSNGWRGTSSDGVTWSAAAHSLTPAPMPNCLAYGKNSKLWITVLDGTAGDLAYSYDQGNTWSKVSGLLADGIYNDGHVRIACDGHGCWLITSVNAANTNFKCYASSDDGVTWDRVWNVDMIASCTGGACFGDGIFVAVGQAGALYSPRHP